MFIGHLFKVKTVFLRLARGNMSSRFVGIYKALNGTPLGELKFNKNLRDIVTMLAVKPG
jgi:hypothetical protein